MTETIRQCVAIKKNGERCKSRPLLEGDTCVLHSERGAQVRAKAVQASVEARQEKVKDRKDRVEESKLTLSQRLAVTAGERAGELVDALVQRAVDGEMAAQRIVWERLEGKVADRLITEVGDPWEMDAGALAKWLESDNAEPSPDESSTVAT